jgi:hypothetical protein
VNKQQEYLNAKRSGQALFLNSFRRWHYAAALQALGETVTVGETKVDLFNRVRAAGKPALDTLKRVCAAEVCISPEKQTLGAQTGADVNPTPALRHAVELAEEDAREERAR